MAKTALYSTKNKTISQASLPKNFTQDVNLVLLAQAVRVYESGYHKGTHKTKTRGEISLSTRKIYKQKGTGMARHGAKSAPIFVGGSKAHGPTGEKRTLNLSKKMKSKALDVALSLKTGEKAVVLVNGIGEVKKTKEASTLVKRIAVDMKTNDRMILIALSEKNKDAYLYFRNIKNVTVTDYRSLNPYLVYKHALVIIDNDQFAPKTKKAKKTNQVKGIK